MGVNPTDTTPPPEAVLTSLIAAAIDHAIVPVPATGKGTLSIRPTAASKRAAQGRKT